MITNPAKKEQFKSQSVLRGILDTEDFDAFWELSMKLNWKRYNLIEKLQNWDSRPVK